MLTCPIPKSEYERVILAHGGGGKLSQQLISKIFASVFDNEILNKMGDSAILDFPSQKLAFTTDSYVVDPIFFPGGNIGELSVYGTVNDLAVSGAEPKYISAGFIIEEGFLIEKLWEITVSMKRAADKAGVKIVTGDTKVVEKGKGDGIFINTAGIGVLKHDIELDPLNCQPGDKIILNGKIGDHGIAILSAREGLSFKSDIKSDTAPLNNMINEILAGSKRVKMMRDVTRGGLSSILNEIAQQGNIGIDIHENSIPINRQVAAACEILGLDSLYIANEGKIIVIADSDECNEILKIMKNNEFGKDASIIGEVVENHTKRVNLIRNIGTRRIIDMISGEQLPRIC